MYLSLDECFMITDETEEIPQGVRHLTVRTKRLHSFHNLSRVKNLRTILFYGTYEGEEFYKVLKSILKRSKSLRTLDLSHRGTDITNLPNVVGRLSHLRYLDISNTKIRWLPKSFSNLCHPQVLEVRQCHLNKLPNNMNKLISLRRLSAESKMVSLISGIGKLTGLQELQEFKVKKKNHKARSKS